MPAVANTSSQFPYRNKTNELLHSGIVSVTGSKEVDLGIGHNNFVPSLGLNGSTAANANLASVVSWAYGSRPGTFVIYAWKATAAGTTTLIAATAAVNISFTAIADSSVG